MAEAILVTGVAGTGKSAVCDELNDLGYKAYDIENVKGLFIMIDTETGKPAKDYDNANFELVERCDWTCDKKKLKKLIKANREKLTFYCGVASNLDDILELFDKIILLNVKERTLRKRLTTRTSNDFGRTKEVQDWIYTWKDWWEKKMCKKGAIEIDTDRRLKKVAEEIIEKSKE